MTDPLLSIRLAGNAMAVLRPLLLAMMLGLAVVLVAASETVTMIETLLPAVLIVATAVALHFLKSGRVAAASYALIGAVLGVGVTGIIAYGSIRSVSNVALVGAVVVAGVFLGRRALFGIIGLISAIVGAAIYAEATGAMTSLNRPVGWIHWLVFSIGCALIGLAVHYARTVALEAHDRQQHELTERVQGEATIRRTEERLRLSMEATRQGWFDLDIPSGAVVSSEQYLKMIGAERTREEVTLQAWMDSIHVDDREAVLAVFQECLASGETRQMDYRLRTRTSPAEWLWIRSIARVVEWDDRHRPIRMTGTHADISEQMRDTAARRASEERYRGMFELAIDGIFQTTVEGKALAANPAFVRMLGYASEAEVLSTLTDLPRGLWAHPEERAAVARLIRTQGHVRGYECQFLRKDGEVIWISLNAGLIHGGEGEGNFLGSISDITERKHAEVKQAALEAQLQQSQKMESVGRLAGGVAHDFNNMLGVIVGRTELALLHLDPGHPARADLAEVHEAAQRSADLTRQLLTYARKQTVAPAVLDLNDAVARSNRMLARLIGEHIHLEWRPGDGLWHVFMDGSQMDQILANLCVNAKDAIAETGSLRITTENYVVDEPFCAMHTDATPGEYVRLTVSDTGHGMSPDVAARIFEPFFTTKGVGEGTGLGLATVYGAVRQNHGFITVASSPGQGTTFALYLPRYAGYADVATVALPAAASVRGRETILVVEDEVSLLRLATNILEGHGYVVLAADSPAKALALAAAHEGDIDLLLTDVVMPGMNGRSLATALRAQRPNIEWLFMSGLPSNVSDSAGMLEDGTRFIGKPFTVAALTGKVREMLDRT